ncbi:type II toxin-antitoxin system HicA family toxin [Microcoleus sp. herbarium14]|uniref:type II toxin-antitoxin system HicA family toxin n=1 Tax=Microcoleus sp. herbarium14 TaxID=3055439 RepID=UPI002FD3A767
MPHPENRPREYDAVLGGQNQPPIGAAVLGGIPGVKSRLASTILSVRIAALSEALKYGNAGLDLVVSALQDESMQKGWFLRSITDSHHIYENLKFKQILSIPAHRDRDWKYGTLRALMIEIAQQSADVAADFSGTNNPNGVWSYGWALTLRSPFVLSSTPRVREGLDSWWGNRAPDGNPGVYHNATGSPIVLGTTTRFEPGQLALHPGPNGEYGLVRWRAPEAGNISIASIFTGLNFVGPTTTDVHILHNNQSIFDNFVEGFGDDSAVRFDRNLAVLQGDTIDFAVGFGRNRTYYHDTTGLALTIALTAP